MSLARRKAALELAPGEHTTLMCVATNAKLEPHQLQRICTHAHDGFARAVVPAHTLADGDIAFAVSMGTVEVPPHEVLTIGVLARESGGVGGLAQRDSLAAGSSAVPSAGQWRS